MYWWKSQTLSCLKPRYKMPYAVRSNTLICLPVITVTKLLFILSNEVKMWVCLCLQPEKYHKKHKFLGLNRNKMIKMAAYVKHWSNSLPYTLKGRSNLNSLSAIERRKAFPQSFPRVCDIWNCSASSHGVAWKISKFHFMPKRYN